MKAEKLRLHIDEYVLEISPVKYKNKNICIDVWLKIRGVRIICATAVSKGKFSFSAGFSFWEEMFGEKQTIEIIKKCEDKIIEWKQENHCELTDRGSEILFID